MAQCRGIVYFLCVWGLLGVLLVRTDRVNNPAIGIDLGTTYSCVGIYRNGRVEIIPNEQGNRITPSYVAFTSEGERLVGESAKNQAALNPFNTVFSVKRLIGRSYTEETVQLDKKLFPFNVGNKGSKINIKLPNAGQKNTFSPEELSAMVLAKMKGVAEAFLGQEVTQAVITVPAYFNDAQRQATKDAGTIAGLQVLRIINEPTAAAIAYGLNSPDSQEQNALVFDLGGGTFDVSLLTIASGVFEVVATAGDTHLGGEDFDQRVLEYFTQNFSKKHKKDLTQDKSALQKLKQEVENAKRALSSAYQVNVEIDDIFEGLNFNETLTRAKFEDLNSDLFRKTLEPVRQVLADAKMDKSEIHEIVLVGGSTRIPKIHKMIKEFFDGKEPNIGVNPDEAIAYGAAVQAGILSGQRDEVISEIVLVDITPLSLGIEMIGGVISVLLPRGTPIPTKRAKVFSTAHDYQTTVNTAVFEGERPLSKDNHKLGEFLLAGLPHAPKGVPQIEVTFEIDSNSILSVKAVDLATGKSNQITISNASGKLNKDDIERMIKEAELFAEHDREITEKIEAKRSFESYAHSMKTYIASEGNLLSSSDKTTIQSAVEEAYVWLAEHPEETKEEFALKLKELEDLCNPIMSAAYRTSASQHAHSDL